MLNKRHKPFLIVVSSPSGAGKTTLCREVVRRDKGIFYSVSVTTRPPRRGEQPDKSYIFVTEEEFQQMINKNQLLEYAQVYGHLYGTPKEPIKKAFARGKDVIADLDIQGMRSCKKLLPDTVTIFIVPPTPQELKQRLLKRGTENQEELRRRQRAFTTELASIAEFDYYIINDKLSKAVRDILSIINAERMRTCRRVKILKEAKDEICIH